jgi:hypothetical protein
MHGKGRSEERGRAVGGVLHLGRTSKDRPYPRVVTQPGEPTVVVFTTTQNKLRDALDVRLGPCVPVSGFQRPLCSPLMQDGLEQPRHTAALYTVLTGDAPEAALTLVEEEGEGRLFIWSTEYVAALASKNAELQALADADDQHGDALLTAYTAGLDALDAAWLAAADWPSHFVGTRNRLAPRLGTASTAQENSQPVWCWYGPSVAMFTVVSGTGPFPGTRA